MYFQRIFSVFSAYFQPIFAYAYTTLPEALAEQFLLNTAYHTYKVIMSGNKKSKTQSEQESNYTLIQCAGIRNLVLWEY